MTIEIIPKNMATMTSIRAIVTHSLTVFAGGGAGMLGMRKLYSSRAFARKTVERARCADGRYRRCGCE